MDLEKLYLHLPVWLQNAVVSVHGWRIERRRFNSRYSSLLEQYGRRTFWDQEQIAAFRDWRLRQTIEHAATTVPYYRDLFAQRGLQTRDFRRLEDLAQLPILTKEEIQKAPERFPSEAFSRQPLPTCHTSGSTGAGLRFPAVDDFQREQWAVWWRYRAWHGLARGTPCLYFGGRSVVPIPQQKPPFWRYSRASRQILFSAYHLGPSTAESYLLEMERSRAPWIHGYPSMVSQIAQYALERGVRLNVRWVTTGAENLLPQQSLVIEEAFGVRPIQHYGMAEGVANISQCPSGKLHVDEDFAAVELVPHEQGGFRVIGTSFANPAFPLLRYEVGDIVSVSGEACDCGRPGRLVHAIDGRNEDCVVTKRGARLGRLDHIFKDSIHVREAQIRQTRAGYMEICVVKGTYYSQRDEQLLIEEIRKRVGKEIDFTLVYVDHIPRTNRGKVRFVISSVSGPSRRAA